MSKLIRFLGIFAVLSIVSATGAHAAKKEPAPDPQKEAPSAYDRADALRTMINPHEQINDEGEVLWGTCSICHRNTPDIKQPRPIKDVQLHFGDEDLNQICIRCHQVKKHPGTEGVSVMMSDMVAPDHLVIPSKTTLLNIRLTLKELKTMLPLDPKTGKVFCGTCHNPHEKGLLSGKADTGADRTMRLRVVETDICQYCHRK